MHWSSYRITGHCKQEGAGYLHGKGLASHITVGRVQGVLIYSFQMKFGGELKRYVGDKSRGDEK